MFDDYDTQIQVEELNEEEFNDWYNKLREEEIEEELNLRRRWEDEAMKAGIFDDDIFEDNHKK